MDSSIRFWELLLLPLCSFPMDWVKKTSCVVLRKWKK